MTSRQAKDDGVDETSYQKCADKYLTRPDFRWRRYHSPTSQKWVSMSCLSFGLLALVLGDMERVSGDHDRKILSPVPSIDNVM